MPTYYIDKNRGLDGNDGLTQATAWQELTKIDDGTAAPGDAFLLADDSEWFYAPTTRVIPTNGAWTGTRANPVTIGKFSPGSQSIGRKPRIRWYLTIPSGSWTYSAPNNCWQYTSPVTINNLCVVRIGGTWLANRIDGTGLPMASVAGRYHNSGTTFSMWAPSGTNPTDYYGGEILLSPGGGFFTISTNRGWVTIQDLEFEDTCAGVQAFSGDLNSVGVVMQRCTGRRTSALFYATGNATQNLAYIARNNDFQDWGATCLSNFCSAGQFINEVEISYNKIYEGMNNYSQGGIYIQPNCVTPGRVFRNYARDVKYGTLGKTSDGSAIYTETLANNIDVYENFVENSHMAFQDNSGATTRWRRNVVLNCKTAIKVSDQFGLNTMNHTFENNTCVVGANVPAAFGGGDDAVGVKIFAEAGTTILSATARDNCIINQGATFAQAISAPTIAPNAFDYSNNGVVGYTDVARRQYTGIVQTSTGSINAASLAALGAAPDGRPSSAASPLRNGGTDRGQWRDIDGVQGRRVIGAYAAAAIRDR